jgi:hypothetical protein
MINIQKTIDIPDEHRIYLDIPSDVPTGAAYIELTLTPVPKPAFRKSVSSYFGCLKNSKIFSGNAVDIQKKMRAEWDS